MHESLKRMLGDQNYESFKALYYKFRHFETSISALLRKKGLGTNKYSKLHSLKDKYLGERCFIISMGPSLTLEDINKLKNEYTFGMNSIIKLFDKTDWRPTFYGIQDKNVYENICEQVLKADLKMVFVSDDLAKRFKVPSTWIQYPLDLLDHNTNFSTFNTSFSEQCHCIVYDGYSITYSLLQLAVHMGFKEIYLLGNDCNYATPNSRFLDHGVKATDISTIGQRMIAAYEVAGEYARNRNIKIYNATRGGKLEVFTRVDLDEVLK